MSSSDKSIDLTSPEAVVSSPIAPVKYVSPGDYEIPSETVVDPTIEIVAPDLSAEIKIDPGTQSGKILRLRGKGVRDINGYGKGDQLIHVNVWTPKKLSKEETETLENLRTSDNFIPSPGKGEKGFFEKIKEFF